MLHHVRLVYIYIPMPRLGIAMRYYVLSIILVHPCLFVSLLIRNILSKQLGWYLSLVIFTFFGVYSVMVQIKLQETRNYIVYQFSNSYYYRIIYFCVILNFCILFISKGKSFIGRRYDKSLAYHGSLLDSKRLLWVFNKVKAQSVWMAAMILSRHNT